MRLILGFSINDPLGHFSMEDGRICDEGKLARNYGAGGAMADYAFCIIHVSGTYIRTKNGLRLGVEITHSVTFDLIVGCFSYRNNFSFQFTVFTLLL